MKTIKKVPLELMQVEFIPPIDEMEFGKFYYAEQWRSSNHLCVCGCGMQVPLPIKQSEWTLSNSDKGFAIVPSILQRMGCKTHYVISNSIANII